MNNASHVCFPDMDCMSALRQVLCWDLPHPSELGLNEKP